MLEVVELDAVEVDAGGLGQVVGEVRADLVALGDAQERAGPHAVVAERLDRRASGRRSASPSRRW